MSEKRHKPIRKNLGAYIRNNTFQSRGFRLILEAVSNSCFHFLFEKKIIEIFTKKRFHPYRY